MFAYNCVVLEGTSDGGAGLAGVEEAVVRWRAELQPVRSAEEARDPLKRLSHLVDVLQLERAGVAGWLAGQDEEEWEGHASPIQWIKHECKVSGHAAADAVSVGLQAERLAQSSAALVAGRIGYGHLALLARTAEDLSLSATATGFDEEPLLRRAATEAVGRFAHTCAHYRHAADARRFLQDQLSQVAARSLELRGSEGGGVFLRGYLDAEGGATLRTALEPLATPVPGDGRSRERRLADSLVEICARALDSGELPEQSGARPHLQVTVSLDSLRGLPGSPAAELERGGPIAAETARRLGCDAVVSRVVFGPRSAVLDVGRAARVPHAPTRRALRVRDGGCVWPGCHRPHSQTRPHHLRHWAHGGPTSLDNLVSLCGRHHFLVHEAGWRLVRRDGGHLADPPWAA
jgi:hypothetical protein